jgi:lysylphosphatidylglycerol synthetase-like protein (DUF2156 family)
MQFINNNKSKQRLEDNPTDQISRYLRKSKPPLEKNNASNAFTASRNTTAAMDIQTPAIPYELRTYPQAWIALLLLVLLRTAVSVFQFTFSVVPNITSQYFNVSLSAVNWLANVQCIVYVIMSFFTGFIFEKLGVKQSVIYSIYTKSARISCFLRFV